MLIHPEKKLVFGLHAKAAARWLERVFIRRGFKIVGSLHEGPMNLTTVLKVPPEKVWWEADPSEWDYAYVVRNHGDALLSWWTTFRGAVPEADQEKVCPVFLREWPRQYARLFPCSRRLWRFVWEMPQASILRFEALGQDVHRYLEAYDLGLLEPWEMERDHKHVTVGKPVGDWRQHYHPEAVEYLKEVYHVEAYRLGYRF
jgi:hypothetical protein